MRRVVRAYSLHPGRSAALRRRWRSSVQSAEFQEGRFLMLCECHDVFCAEPQQASHVLGRAISEADPDDVGRRAEEHAQAVEVLVLGDEDESVRRRPGPMLRSFAPPRPSAEMCAESG